MTTKEFSENFDTLIQSYAPQFYAKGIQSPLQFDEFEKSMFLTKAQNELVNTLAESFEQDETVRRQLAILVTTTSFTTANSTGGIESNSLLFTLPSNAFKVVFEKVKINSTITCFNGTEISVFPIKHDEYRLQKNNPFRKPKLTGLTQKAWRLDTGNNVQSLELVLPPDSTLNTYTIRYLKKPKPIVLTDFTENSIEGVTEETDCELDSFLLHERILERAVQIALSAISVSNSEK